jgi:hypothetical protein
MRERSDDGTTRPLPHDWLPAPQPSEGDRTWDERIERIMAAAGPELRTLRSRCAAGAAWWSVMGLWWKPAAALAVASTTLLLLMERPAFAERPRGSLALGFVASAGDPVTLWGALGVQADPVLAWIAIREQGDVAGQAAPPPTQEENR